MDIPEKLRQMGFVMRKKGSGEPIVSIPEEFVEYLAKREHESWMAERKASGWVVGDHVDAEKKITPYLVPFCKLPEGYPAARPRSGTKYPDIAGANRDGCL